MQETEHNPIVDEAADWVSRIQSGDVEQTGSAALRSWLQRSEEHQRVFQRMVEVHQRSGVIVSPAIAQGSIDSRRRAALRPRPLLAAAAAVVLAVGFTLWMLADAELSYATSIGERRLVTLEDGSSVHLNVHSSVSVAFTGTERLATMQSGDVVFDVNSDDERPFIVRSGALQVTVTGTAFQVSQSVEQTVVAVIEGSVAVRAEVADQRRDEGPRASAAMRAGERVTYGNTVDGETGLSRPERIDPSRVAAWREGWLYLDRQPLRELADRLYRQYGEEVDIPDRELAESHVTLALKLGRKSETLSELRLLLPVRVEEQPGGGITLHVVKD